MGPNAHSGQIRNDLLKTLSLDTVKVLRCWADCGAHFRSYEFLWNLAEHCRDTFAQVHLHFFAEHHGKGRCDGAFGLQRRWVADYARSHTIDSLEGMRKALESGAAETMCQDPPPRGPNYLIKVFEPEPKRDCKKLDTSGIDLQIEYTYCIVLERAPRGHVRIHNYVFSDRPGLAKPSILVGKATYVVQKCTDEWRRSYRAQKPERTPLNVTLLQRRLAKQKDFADTVQFSRRDPLLVALRRREKRQAHNKAKFQRQKRVLAVNLQEDSASSADTGSSSGSE